MNFWIPMIPMPLHNPLQLFRTLESIWNYSGPHYDDKKPNTGQAARQVRYRDSVVDSTIRFLHDHLQRDLIMAEPLPVLAIHPSSSIDCSSNLSE
jgi:hypothetical protein